MRICARCVHVSSALLTGATLHTAAAVEPLECCIKETPHALIHQTVKTYKHQQAGSLCAEGRIHLQNKYFIQQSLYSNNMVPEYSTLSPWGLEQVMASKSNNSNVENMHLLWQNICTWAPIWSFLKKM